MPAVLLRDVRATIRSAANPERALGVARFFKTAAGEYGEGDRFLGITVPELRKIARSNRALSRSGTLKLLDSPWHEERLVALVILVTKHQEAAPEEATWLHRAYLANTAWVNNWDLVDVSAAEMVGSHIAANGMGMLERLARSSSVWERRIAIIATFWTIKRDDFTPTLMIAERLLEDEHDLIHKAVGWMLRETGNRDVAVLRQFLDRHATTMPRVALRYAIERLGEQERRRYLAMRRP